MTLTKTIVRRGKWGPHRHEIEAARRAGLDTLGGAAESHGSPDGAELAARKKVKNLRAAAAVIGVKLTAAYETTEVDPGRWRCVWLVQIDWAGQGEPRRQRRDRSASGVDGRNVGAT